MTFTDEEKLALFDLATKFTIYPTGTDITTDDRDNLRHHIINVEQSASGKWMIWNAAQQAWNNTDKKWYSALLPDMREKRLQKQTRYELDEALELAHQLRDIVKVNGRTYTEWQEVFNTK